MNLAVMIAVLLDPVALLLLAIGGVVLGKKQSPAWLCIGVGICIALIMGIVVYSVTGPFRTPITSFLPERILVYSLALFLIRWVTMRMARNRVAKEE
jgi:hypothetical protein